MQVYVVDAINVFSDWNKRVGAYHATVFHGTGYYAGEAGSPHWRPPSATNDNREPWHLTRSGVFVPPVFGDRFTLIVSEEVRGKLAEFRKLVFNEVVFEKLVDMAMPALGDFSWLEQGQYLQEEPWSPNDELSSLPDKPELHATMGRYYELLVPNLYEVKSNYSDVRRARVDFGSYANITGRREEIDISARLVEEWGVVDSIACLFREDAFEKIAPFLNLDYYGIAVVEL